MNRIASSPRATQVQTAEYCKKRLGLMAAKATVFLSTLRFRSGVVYLKTNVSFLLLSFFLERLASSALQTRS